VSAQSHRERLAAVVGREWNRLVRVVRSWIDDESDRDAEDIVQDVMEGLFERADPAAPIADLTAYVYRSVRNRVVDTYRRRRAPRSEIYAETADSRYEAGEALVRAEDQALLDAAVDALPEAQRAVIVATELEGRSFRELSAKWRVPVGTLLARKHRGIRALRKALGGAT